MDTGMKFGLGAILAVLLIGGVGTAMYFDGKEIIKDDVFYIVSNTEYWTGEQGKIAARFVDFKGDPIIANCNVTIIYPNETSYFVQTVAMSNSLITGDYYYLFTVPTIEGVYDYSVTCIYQPNNQERTQSKTFHVNPALNKIKILDEINETVVEINGRTIEINTTVNSIYVDTQDIRNTMVTDTEFANNMTIIFNELDDIDTNLTTLMNYCGNVQTNGSSLCLLVNEIDNKVTDINTTINTVISNQLAEINATTQNTYTYITGTLATNINNIYNIVFGTQTTVNEINATVNTINTTTTQILSNTSQILENQEAEVELVIVS